MNVHTPGRRRRAGAATAVAASLLLVLWPAAGVAAPTDAATDTPTDDATPGDDATAPPAAATPPVLGLAPDERPTLPPNVGGWPSLPPTTAASVVVVDQDSRTVLAARDADRLRSVASTVKMLTAVTARRLEPDLDRLITAGPEVRGLEGSGVGLGEGERWTLRQLLEAMLVRSGNDAAAALAAQLVPGGTDAFLAEMRLDAERLGLDGAVLVSPSGLDDGNLLSAAHLATIALELLDDPVLAEIVDQQAVRLPGLGGVPNRNELVHRDPTVIGIKTGFTEAAGYSLVAAAEREGRITVVVVLDSAGPEERFEDASRLLDHAEAFESLPVLAAVELGCAGRSVTLRPSATAVVVPSSSADLVEVSWPPARCPTTPTLLVTPTLQRLPLEPVDVVVEAVDVSAAVDGDGALGRWLADAAQRAMRAVDVAAAVDG